MSRLLRFLYGSVVGNLLAETRIVCRLLLLVEDASVDGILPWVFLRNYAAMTRQGRGTVAEILGLTVAV